MTDIKDQFWQKSFLLFLTSDIHSNIYSDSWVSIIMKLLKSIILANSITNAERFERDSDPDDHANVSLKVSTWSKTFGPFSRDIRLQISKHPCSTYVYKWGVPNRFWNSRLSRIESSPLPLNRPWIMIHRTHLIWMEDYSHRSGQARLMSKEKSSLISTSI